MNIENMSLEITYDTGENLESISDKLLTKIKEKIAVLKRGENVEYNTHSLEKPEQKYIHDAFFFFLENGKYPWWFDECHQFTIEDLKSVSTSRLKTIISSNNSLNRLVYQFDNKLIIYIFTKLYVLEKNNVEKHGKIPSLLKKEPFKSDFWRLVFNQKLIKNPIDFPSQFLRLFAEKVLRKTISKKYTFPITNLEENLLLEVLLFCNKSLALPLYVTTQNATFLNLDYSTKKGMDFVIKTNTEILTNKFKKFVTKQPIITPQKEEKNPNLDPQKNLQKAEENDEGIIVQNAGLILIHPFIKHFFKKLNFLSKKHLKKHKKDEAVHVLHYLACKQEQPSEHILSFEKYLCGIPQNQPIKRHITVTKEQKLACEELLKAMLTHWETLKTNNTDVLRNEFLMREGKLTQTSEKHKLYIQRKTQDILLNQLPWNIGFVKIEWIPKPIYIEW